MRQKPSRDALAADGFADRDDEIRRPAIEPAVQDVRADRLDDVAGTDEGPPRLRQAVRDGRQPMFLAAMDMDDVCAGEPRANRSPLAPVGNRPKAPAPGQGLGPLP